MKKWLSRSFDDGALSVMRRVAPPLMATALPAYFSNLSAGLTHYGATPGPIYFDADYVTQQKWHQFGLIASVLNILMLASVGLVWWKILGWW
jgi:DASS family divalent anion:Na+ symporter